MSQSWALRLCLQPLLHSFCFLLRCELSASCSSPHSLACCPGFSAMLDPYHPGIVSSTFFCKLLLSGCFIMARGKQQKRVASKKDSISFQIPQGLSLTGDFHCGHSILNVMRLFLGKHQSSVCVWLDRNPIEEKPGRTRSCVVFSIPCLSHALLHVWMHTQPSSFGGEPLASKTPQSSYACAGHC